MFFSMRMLRCALWSGAGLAALVLGWEGACNIHYQAGLMAYRDGNVAVARLILPGYARAGRDEAQYDLGMLELADHHAVQASEWLRLAANQGHERAAGQLAALYWHGEGVARDDAVAEGWFLKSVARGDAEAEYELATFYRAHHDLTLAMAWFRHAASHGHVLAQAALGHMYEVGEGVARNEAEADAWFDRVAAASEASPSVREAYRRAALAGNDDARQVVLLCWGPSMLVVTPLRHVAAAPGTVLARPEGLPEMGMVSTPAARSYEYRVRELSSEDSLRRGLDVRL